MNDQYRKDYQEFDREARWMVPKILCLIIFVVVCLAGAGLAIQFFTSPMRLASKTLDQAERVADREVLPEAINRKYNWFKDQASAIRAQKANVDLLRGNLKAVEAQAQGRQLSRTAEERLAIQAQDLSNTVLAYNRMVGEYNAEMAKWHTQFTNFGAMPQGWSDITPSKFPEYITQ